MLSLRGVVGCIGVWVALNFQGCDSSSSCEQVCTTTYTDTTCSGSAKTNCQPTNKCVKGDDGIYGKATVSDNTMTLTLYSDKDCKTEGQKLPGMPLDKCEIVSPDSDNGATTSGKVTCHSSSYKPSLVLSDVKVSSSCAEACFTAYTDDTCGSKIPNSTMTGCKPTNECVPVDAGVYSKITVNGDELTNTIYTDADCTQEVEHITVTVNKCEDSPELGNFTVTCKAEATAPAEVEELVI